MRRLDGPIIVYSLIVAAGLIVSGPATYSLVARYHSDNTPLGIAATVALLVILEVGAVASKLATLWAPEARRWLIGFTVVALGVNTLSNWLHGAALATANGLGWFAAWAGALLYAALIPVLIYLMLSLIVQRVALHQGIERTTADEVAIVLRPVAHAVAVAAEAQRTLASLVPLPALPEPQASYPRALAVEAPEAAQPVAMLPTACPACGAAPTAMQLRTAKQHNGWTCKGCGKRVLPQ
jgi:hypothetical protein